MTTSEIDRLRAVTIAVTDLARSTAFYTQTWGLQVAAEKPGSAVFLRATGRDHHCLVLNQGAAGQRAGLVSVTFGVPDRAALLQLYERLVTAGVPTEQPPRALPAAGGGWGFAFHDPEGRVFKVVADREDRAEAEPAQTRPVALAHVVLNSTDAAAATRFFTDVVGLRISDRTKKMSFLRCNATHHVIAVADSGNTSLNHIAFEMASWNELMFGVGRLKEAGHRVQWGVGRHGPGDNVFAYFLDPDGLAIEYTAEVQQIDDATHVPGTPEQWVRPPNRMDQWGHADLPTPAMQAAMHGDTQTGSTTEAAR